MTNQAERIKIDGILAYGSVISDPGWEILKKLISSKGGIIDTFTPFRVEFARSSRTRGGAPTLVPFENGKRVRCKIFAMGDNVYEDEAADILYRREIHAVGEMNKTYTEPSGTEPNKKVRRKVLGPFSADGGFDFGILKKNKTFIGRLTDFAGLGNVLFPILASNIEPLTVERLACLAVVSVHGCNLEANSCDSNRDGISYLINAKQHGIVTRLSPEYEKEILRVTQTGCLDQALNQTRKSWLRRLRKDHIDSIK